ncbi:MAG TPA: Flp family type IVb pilin [Polyangia bacterium]|nr:Flp family type IVb pilin [Polyangia bacterium]
MDDVLAMRRLLRLANDRSGATVVEYAIIVGAIGAVIAIVLYALGAKTRNLYNTVNTADW